jgi:hypothetical protein
MNNRSNTKAKKRRENSASPARVRTYLLMAVCALTMVSGFFFAGRQHFSSIDYGMKNSRLRRQIDELEAEKKRLLLAREVSLSPAEIKKAARRTGLVDDVSKDAMVVQVINSTKDKAVPVTPTQTKPLVVKTSAVTPAEQPPTMAYLKTAKLIRPSKAASPAN